MPDPAATTITNILRSPLGARYLGTTIPDGGKAETTGCPRRWRRPSTRRICSPRRFVATAATRRSTSPPSSTGARRGGPALSGGCPICMTAAQKVFVDATRKPFGDLPAASVVADVVYVRAAVDDGALDGHAFDPLRRRLDQALGDCRVRAFGGFDISANRHEHGEFAPFWCPHARIFTSARLDEPSVNKRFRAWFPRDARDAPSRSYRGVRRESARPSLRLEAGLLRANIAGARLAGGRLAVDLQHALQADLGPAPRRARAGAASDWSRRAPVSARLRADRAGRRGRAGANCGTKSAGATAKTGRPRQAEAPLRSGASAWRALAPRSRSQRQWGEPMHSDQRSSPSRHVQVGTRRRRSRLEE